MHDSNRTPLAVETRETAGDDLALPDILQHYVDAMGHNGKTDKNKKLPNII